MYIYLEYIYIYFKYKMKGGQGESKKEKSKIEAVEESKVEMEAVVEPDMTTEGAFVYLVSKVSWNCRYIYIYIYFTQYFIYKGDVAKA